MGFGQFARRWLPAILLGIAAFATWSEAERRDTDVVSVEEIDYDRVIQTPMLAARRIPRTLQAPVVDASLIPVLRAMIDDSPSATCLAVRVSDRLLEPSSRLDQGLVPASNQKLMTTYGALLTLGEDFRFVTRVLADREPVNGAVDGNLYLVGSGDPFLSTDNWWTQYDQTDGRFHTRLEDLADRIAAAGVTQIAGTVVGDETLLDTERQGLWAERLINAQHSGPLSALTVNEGFNDWPEVYVSDRQRSATPDPAVHGASVLIQLLGERGITVGEPAVSGAAPTGALPIAQIESPPLLNILAHVNSFSSNLGAELLLKQIGVASGGEGSASAGASALLDTLAADGIPLDQIRVDDGSGLAETNLLTCQAVIAILANAGPESDFARGLAVAGERGTLAGRMVDTPGAGSVFAKTGTLNDATALSGYVQSLSDADVDLMFAYIANDPFVGSNQDILGLQDSFASALTAYPGSPSVEEISPLEPAVN